MVLSVASAYISSRISNLPACPLFVQGVKLTKECQAVGLQSFPTWIIGDQKLEGEQSFKELQKLLPPQ